MSYILLFVLAVVCFIDIKTKHIPNSITVTGMLCGLVYNHFGLMYILGIFFGLFSIYMLNILNIKRLGGGDAKLMAMLGAFLGIENMLTILALSVLISLPYKMYLIMKEKKGATAYSPIIGIATLLVMIYG